jgi:RAT1-interacting protein
MTAPYDRDPWEMMAIALDGSVYIELHDPPDVRAERERRQSAWAAQSYMGVAYESFSTVPAPASAPALAGESGGKEAVREEWPEGWSGDVNTNVQVRAAGAKSRGSGARVEESAC